MGSDFVGFFFLFADTTGMYRAVFVDPEQSWDTHMALAIPVITPSANTSIGNGFVTTWVHLSLKASRAIWIALGQ